MAEIKFTTARMNEVSNRLDEIQNQLTSALKSDAESLNEIASNIQSDAIAGTLKAYADANTQKGDETVKLIQQLNEYLKVQIGNYTTTDSSAQSAISEVQGILNGIQ